MDYVSHTITYDWDNQNGLLSPFIMYDEYS